MSKHRPAPGRHRVDPHRVAAFVDRHGSRYPSTGYPCVPFRLALAGFVCLLAVIASSGVTVAPADPMPVTLVVASDVPVAWGCGR